MPKRSQTSVENVMYDKIEKTTKIMTRIEVIARKVEDFLLNFLMR